MRWLWSYASSGSKLLAPNKAPLYGSLAAVLATFWPCQQHGLATTDFRLLLALPNAKRIKIPQLLANFCFEEQWHCGCTHRVPAPGKAKEKPSLEGGCPREYIEFAPVWWRLVKYRLLFAPWAVVSLALSWLSLQSCRNRGKADSARGTCFPEGAVSREPILSHLRWSSQKDVLSLGGSLEGQLLKGEQTRLLSFLCLSS